MPAILGLAILIGVFACVFALQNTDVIAVSFLTWKAEASLALVLLTTFALGAAMGLLACLPALIKAKWANRSPAEPKKVPAPAPKPDVKEGPRNL